MEGQRFGIIFAQGVMDGVGSANLATSMTGRIGGMSAMNIDHALKESIVPGLEALSSGRDSRLSLNSMLLTSHGGG